MDNPRAEKVAVVDEVRDRLAAADGAVLTEYRGLTVADLAALRRGLTAAGGDYKIYKNTLVRLAVAEGPQSALTDLLTGPTAIAFVHGDVERGGQGPPRLRPGQPEPGDEGRHGGRRAALRRRHQRPRRPAQPGRAHGPGGRGPRRSAPAAGRPVQALPRNLAYGLAALADQRRAAGEGDVEADTAAARWRWSARGDRIAPRPAGEPRREPSRAEAARDSRGDRSWRQRLSPGPRRPTAEADAARRPRGRQSQ